MSKPKLSVITAAHPAGYQWLPNAAASLLRQTASLRWIVIADDRDIQGIVDHLGGMPRQLRRRTTFLATGKVGLGASAARTVGLTSVETPWLMVLDADDQLLPAAPETLLAAAESEQVGWVAGRCDELTPAGRRPHRPEDYLPDQRIGRGKILHIVEAGLLPWHGCSLLASTDLVRAVGGWPPFPVAEDFALSVAMGAVADGFAVDHTTLLYRKWGDVQTTERSDYAELRAFYRPLAINRARRLQEAWRLVSTDGSYELPAE